MFFGKQRTSLESLLDRQRPSAWQRFLSKPCVFLAHYFYNLRHVTQEVPMNPVSVVCISDTHNSQPNFPLGDILIHAGDLTQSGSLDELEAAIAWLNSQPHPHKIIVGGNHDILLDRNCDRSKKAIDERKELDWGSCIYIDNATTTITCTNGRRLKVYGSPLSPRHGNWAFQYPRGQDVWSDTIPDDIDILVTHGPPFGHLDLMRLGCHHLLQELWRVQPLLHVFGHVHEGHGHERAVFDKLQRAYERTLSTSGGVLNVLAVLKELLVSLCRAERVAICQLVNPTMVGGLRDDERRQPITVDI